MNQFPLSRVILIAVLGIAAGMVATVPVRAAMEPAVPVRTVAPIYPYELKRDGITGVVSVAFEVDEQGNVQDATVQKSSSISRRLMRSRNGSSSPAAKMACPSR